MAIFLDCTPRDGGYYNAWDFSPELINDYLLAMKAVNVDYVELGLRSLKNDGFKGANAYTTDEYLRSLNIPDGLSLGVMLNAAELISETPLERVLEALFPEPADTSRVKLVRIACHLHEFREALPSVYWLKERGFLVGFNLMQIAGRTQAEVEALATEAASYPLDVLYFADSMGSMKPEDTAQIVSWLRKGWKGPLGIHTHDNMGLALQNSIKAMDCGVEWIDSTITGMGRGPGNAKTEQLAIEMSDRRGAECKFVPLLSLIRRVFKPMQERSGWGTSPYYYLAGKYGIHPSYIQEMQGDSRYSEADILAVIEYLRSEGGNEFSLNTLDAARHFYQGSPGGTWSPINVFNGRDVLLLGTGPGVSTHQNAIEAYVERRKPLVLALNTESGIKQELIELRIACHPTRLLADCEAHTLLPQPLITPASMLPNELINELKNKKLLDYGLSVSKGRFEFNDEYSVIPVSLVLAYALAVLASGKANRILMAGFDGYAAGDNRNQEVNHLLRLYENSNEAIELLAITPTAYEVKTLSVYGPEL
jgi:4-hydroxy 2-oxovalerate aldolase